MSSYSQIIRSPTEGRRISSHLLVSSVSIEFALEATSRELALSSSPLSYRLHETCKMVAYSHPSYNHNSPPHHYIPYLTNRSYLMRTIPHAPIPHTSISHAPLCTIFHQLYLSIATIPHHCVQPYLTIIWLLADNPGLLDLQFYLPILYNRQGGVQRITTGSSLTLYTWNSILCLFTTAWTYIRCMIFIANFPKASHSN